MIGVEAGDGGHLAEAKAVALFHSLGKQTEGGDSAAAVEERILEFRDVKADGRDATEACDDNALQQSRTPGEMGN